ncbi:MAG: hypothetical protein WC642_03260 [Nocardioides sp.]|jgi:Ca2+-binding RTX toxin-like protein
MWATRPSLRPFHVAAAFALALAASLVAAVPAQAAATASITRDGRALVINATAAPATIYLGYSTLFGDPTVTFRLPGEGFSSWPADCSADYPVGLPDQYVHCWAADVDDLNVTFGPGNDTLYMDGVCYGVITVNFGDGGNTMQGDTNCNTVINSTSGSGDDVVQMASGGGSATLGGGNDQFRGGIGNESANGGAGNDSLGGNSGNDTLRGQDGNDAIAGNYGNDVEDGGNGDDVIGNFDDDQGADNMIGGPGIDKVWFSDHSGGGMALSMDNVANDGTSGEGDNLHSDFEIVVGSPGADTISGTAAADNLDGYWGADTIRGGAGNDRIDGNSDDDVLFGGDGDDTVYGGGGNDQVTGDRGADNLFGDYTGCCLNNGNDKIFSADGIVDAINCGGGADALKADRRDIIGGDGNQLCESVVVSDTPAPNTTITKHPRNQTSNRVAKFAFKSSKRGSRFKCKVDGKPWKTCSSPYQVRVRPGRHTFRVRAIDAAGNVDPTPAIWRWRVR